MYVEQLIHHLRQLYTRRAGDDSTKSKNHPKLDSLATIDIETTHLKKLCDIGEKFGGASKTSGAGGGDCGITIVENNINKQKIYDEWTKNCIKPLLFNIYHGQ